MNRMIRTLTALVVAAGISTTTLTGTAHAATGLKQAKVSAVVKVNGHKADFTKARGTRVAKLTWRGKVVGPKVQKLRPCKFEDSPNCYWLASNMGDGAGKSFIDLNGRAYYLR